MKNTKAGDIQTGKIAEQSYIRSGLPVHTGLQAGIALGDGFANLTHFMGIDKVAAFYTKTTGNDCGCKYRQEWMNRLMPKC